jgi:LysR family transcriptional regulator, glycine cleavage system transcriptional activator
MSIRLPPLNALRCFETAARKGNFTLAADELCLTPSAVSHQIRALEDHLGVLLFSRAGRRMMLTETGQTYFKLTSSALETIATARSIVEQTQQRETLCIGVPPDFTTSWLMARLPEFMAEHPHLQLELSTSPRDSGLVERQIDVEIRYGHGKWPTLTAFHLMDDHLVPVCSPNLATARKPLRTPGDVLKHILIYTGNRPINWRHWGEQFDVSGIEGAASMEIDRCALAVRAAIEGIGIALESRLSVESEIRAGKLITPLSECVCDEEAYYLVSRKTGNEVPKVRRFREWIVSKAKSESEQSGAGKLVRRELSSLAGLVNADA